MCFLPDSKPFPMWLSIVSSSFLLNLNGMSETKAEIKAKIVNTKLNLYPIPTPMIGIPSLILTLSVTSGSCTREKPWNIDVI